MGVCYRTKNWREKRIKQRNKRREWKKMPGKPSVKEKPGKLKEEPGQPNTKKQPDDSSATHEGSAIQQIRRCDTDGHLKLADRLSLPVVIGACNKHRNVPTHQNMPVSEDFIGERKANILRDTGCRSAAVRSSLVSDIKLT